MADDPKRRSLIRGLVEVEWERPHTEQARYDFTDDFVTTTWSRWSNVNVTVTVARRWRCSVHLGRRTAEWH